MSYKKNTNYKVDIFRTEKKYKNAMLLYATGSKVFNIKMRTIAKKKGYTLNQKGLYKNGKLIPIKSEKGFFKKLDMDYLEPEERN